jgi:Holliday junction resolvase
VLESNIQRKIVAYLKQLGYCAFKVDSSSTVGLCDLVAISPDGVVLFLEIKTATGRLSKMQEHVIKKLRTNNANCYVVRSVAEVKTILEASNCCP